MVAHGWRLGGMQMRSNGSRFRRSSALAVVGGCLAVYAVLAVGFHWFVEPTLGKNQAVSAYDPSPARIVPLSGPPAVAPARSEAPSRLASKPTASTKVRSAGPATTEAIRSEPPSRGAPPPMMTIVKKPAPTETARSESPSPVASEQPTSDTVAATESTEAAPAPAKKTHNKRKTVRHERRDFWNPMNFFAWGSNGARRSF